MLLYLCVFLVIFFLIYLFCNVICLLICTLFTILLTRWLFLKLIYEDTLWNSDFFFKYLTAATKFKAFIAKTVEDYFNPPGKGGYTKKSSVTSSKVIPNDKQCVFNEICFCIDYILRDFIYTWYENIAVEEQVPAEFKDFLENLFVCFCDRFQKISIRKGVEHILLESRLHFLAYKDALLEVMKLKNYHGELSDFLPAPDNIQELYQHYRSYHIAVHSREKEIQYLRSSIKLLMQVLVSKDVIGCTPYQTLICELLTSNVLLPVIDMMSEPDWINERIIVLLSSANDRLVRKKKIMKNKCQDVNLKPAVVNVIINEPTPHISNPKEDALQNHEYIKVERIPTIEAFTTDELALYFNVLQKTESDVEVQKKSSTESETATHRNSVSKGATKLFRRHSSYLERSDKSKKTTENSTLTVDDGNRKSRSFLNLTENFQHSETDSSNGDYTNEINLHIDEPLSDQSKSEYEDTPPSYARCLSCPVPKPSSLLVELPKFYSVDQSPTCHHSNSLSPDLAQEAVENTFNFSMTAGRLFENIRIPTTETRKEHRSSHLYTLYYIEYDAWYKAVLQINGSDQRQFGGYFMQPASVKRRFREFLNLQNRLEDNRKLRKNLKGVKGLSKWLTLPFGNMDQGNVEQRRKLLESFLQALCKRPDLNMSNEVREFLAYGSDAGIAYVRNCPELPVPRIDKLVARTVVGVFDKIKTALPSLPQERSYLKDSAISRKESRNSPTMENFEDPDQLHLCYGYHTQKPLHHLLENMTMGQSRDSDSKVEAAEEACSETPSEKSESPIFLLPIGPRSQGDGCDITELGAEIVTFTKELSDMGQDIPLANAVLELGIDVIRHHQSWLALGRMVHTFKLLFGKMLDRWLNWHIEKLLSPVAWAGYIRLLKDTVWPNAILGVKKRTEKSESEKEATKEEALIVLKNFFPGFLEILLGKDQYSESLKLVLDVFQHPQLNRHLLYNLLDLLLDLLIPETRNKDFRQQFANVAHQKVKTPTSPYQPSGSLFNRPLT